MGSESLILEERSPQRWEQFLEGRPPAEASPLLSVWSRSRRFNVDPSGPERVEQIEPAQQLHERRQRSGEVWGSIEPLFQRMAARLADHDFVSLLADPEGVVLWSAGGGSFREHAERVRLMEGAHWSESVRGTNAIGTALFERRPVAVVGCAHFERSNHQLVCYGHPIVDAHGRIAALLDVTSSLRRADEQVRMAVAIAVDGMEQLLRHQAWVRALGGAGRIEQVLGGRSPSLLVSSTGEVVRSNDAAGPLLERGRLDPAVLQAAARGEPVAEVTLAGVSHRVVVDAVGEPSSLGHLVRLEPRSRVSARPRRRARSSAFSRLRGDDPRFEDVLDRAARFARTDVPVLLLAETGAGKELLARAIHDESPRRNEALVTVNCGAFAPELVASELFGYVGGAFTGALRQGSAGLLARADGGTLFLDEVAEMPFSLQAALLRVLEDGSYSRVGESRVRRVDVRLVCATCRDLPRLVREGRFREDLYYRIHGVALALPALRERDDLLLVARELLGELALAQHRSVPALSEPVVAWMLAHPWPGNIRELRSTLEHALVLADGRIELGHLPRAPVGLSVVSEPIEEGPPIESPARSRAQADAAVVRRALEGAGGNLSEAARRLGVARSTLYRLLDRYGLR